VRHAIRYEGLPRFGAMAFVATSAQDGPAATNGQNLITGNPGTMRVPTPRPASTISRDWGGQWQPASQAPDWIMPSIYTFHPNASVNPFRRTGAGIGSDHPVAVPAGVIGQVVSQFMHRARIGGRTVTAAIRPFTQWPTYGGGTA